MNRVISAPLTFIATAMLLVPGLHPAQAQEGGQKSDWYSEFRTGITFLDDSDLRHSTPGENMIAQQSEFDFDSGFMVGGSLGYRIGNKLGGLWRGLRLETDLTYSENDISGFGGNPEISAVTFMGNVYYDFYTSTRFTPYIGGGLGGSFINIDGLNLAENDDTVFTWQLRAGIAYEINPKMELLVGYRYLDADEAKFRDAFNETFEAEYAGSTVEIGVRYNW